MTRIHLRCHLWTWCTVAPALAGLLVLALLNRPLLPAPDELPSFLAMPVAESR